MTDIRAVAPATYALSNVERTNNNRFEKDANTSFPTLLRAQGEHRPGRSDAVSTKKQPESAMAMARRQNTEAMLQQLLAYGKKYLYTESKSEKSAPRTSLTTSLLTNCNSSSKLLPESTEMVSCGHPNEYNIDVCASQIQEAAEWLATYCEGIPASCTSFESAPIVLQGLFVWVWIPAEKSRASILWGRNRRRPRPAVNAADRYTSAISSNGDDW